MQANTAMKAAGGRNASRERRSMLVQGKAALPAANNRTRTGDRKAEAMGAVPPPAPAPAPVSTPAAAEPPARPVESNASTVASAPASRSLTGRDASRARREALVRGKSALQQTGSVAETAVSETAREQSGVKPLAANTGRGLAQALRAQRARNGRGGAESSRPSGRVRAAQQPVEYAAKVADSETYASQKVTGVRIGRGGKMTGDERGTNKQITGSQYIGRETGFSPREGGVKVGAASTTGGQVVTGTQVRNKIMITGDESNKGIRITGEADQELADDLTNRREQGGYASMQFQRQHNPHGHTVFGTNLGRSAKAIGSRDRDTSRAIEQTDGGLPISGTAVGRSVNTTGDEAGSCRGLTGDQYLMPARSQALCGADGKPVAYTGATMANSGARNGRQDPVTANKVVVSESWTRKAVTGVDVEHNENVTGDEYGVCSSLTGTPYVGPGQVESFCEADKADDAIARATPGMGPGNRVTGDTPLNAEHITGTQRGGERDITGTPYYRDDVEDACNLDAVDRLDRRFSVRSPQREGQLNSDPEAANAPSAEVLITGSFAVGGGKVTGKQEFHFSPRILSGPVAHTQITGEGKMDGPEITGSAWGEHNRITGTEDYISAERNPSEGTGNRDGFAGARVFQGKGKDQAARELVTGKVGGLAKQCAKVTLSGGALG